MYFKATEKLLYDYKELKSEIQSEILDREQEYKEMFPSLVAQYSEMISGQGQHSDEVARYALTRVLFREEFPDELREKVKAVAKVDFALTACNELERDIFEAKYKQEHTNEEAAEILNMARSTFLRRRKDFVKKMARRMNIK